MVHITEFGNGNIRYELYCKGSAIIYSYTENPNIKADSVFNKRDFDIFDVAAYRDVYKTTQELSDSEEKEIRKIMANCNSQEECQKQLNEAGYSDISVKVLAGVWLRLNTRLNKQMAFMMLGMKADLFKV